MLCAMLGRVGILACGLLEAWGKHNVLSWLARSMQYWCRSGESQSQGWFRQPKPATSFQDRRKKAGNVL